MKISIGLYPDQPSAALLATGKLVDGLGYDTLWVADSHLLWREVYVMLGALATSTSRVRLATAVTNPLTRHPTVTAAAFVTLSELSGGRAMLGLSVGDSALRSMGLEIATMARLEQTVARFRDLFAGREAVLGDIEGWSKSAKGGGSDAPAASPEKAGRARISYGPAAVPIYIAATGPKMLELSGRIADGVVLMNGVAPDLIAKAIELVRVGERKAGRPEGSTKIVVWSSCHPSASAVKYNVARAILRNIPGADDPLTRQTAEAVRKAYDYAQHGSAGADFAELIPDALLSRYVFSGSMEHIKAQVAALSPLGVDEVALAVPQAKGVATRDEVIRAVAPVLLAR